MTITKFTAADGTESWMICIDKEPETAYGNKVHMVFDKLSDALRMYHYLNGGEIDLDIIKILRKLEE